ncbi:MAG TPA: DUF1622 domain-containing protein [Candidatus Norongarragalinales archaeon]|nr:DUF1622 domain-containing protein [Candidatus Norongarragalinales archaeon]
MGTLLDFFGPLVDDAGLIIDAFGILVIVAASLFAAIHFVQAEVSPENKRHFERERNKRVFVHRLIFGLDFLIAGDVLKSVFTPTLDKLFLVGGIVVIRSVLSFSLLQELAGEKGGQKG